MCPPLYDALSMLPEYVPASTSSGVSGTLFVYLILIFIYLLTFFFLRIFISSLLCVLPCTIPCQSSLDMVLSLHQV